MVINRLLVVIITFLLFVQSYAQRVFTMVSAATQYDFVNVREKPTSDSAIMDKVEQESHGLSNAFLLEKGKWSKVQTINGVVGFCNTKYLNFRTWFTGIGNRLLVTKVNAPVYSESMGDEFIGSKVFVIKAGTIIADDFEDFGEYWYLNTVHDNLYVCKECCIVQTRKRINP